MTLANKLQEENAFKKCSMDGRGLKSDCATTWDWGYLNSLRPRQNEQHFADDIFKRIFVNENVWISIEISLKFVPKGPINNIPALVQIMAWRRSGDKPLSEPMMVSFPTHICVTRPQWVNINLSSLERCGCDFKCEKFKCNMVIDIWSIQVNITLEWMSEDQIDDKSTLVQVMAWCCQVTYHYLNHC